MTPGHLAASDRGARISHQEEMVGDDKRERAGDWAGVFSATTGCSRSAAGADLMTDDRTLVQL